MYLQKVVINKCKHVITKSWTIDYWSILQMARVRANKMVTTTALTCTVDTDVIVILVGKFFNLLSLSPN